MTTLLLILLAMLELALLAWIVIDHLRRILDALHLLAAQGSARRQWAKEEHSTQ